MIEHVKLQLHDDDPRVKVFLHTTERTITPPMTEAQLRAALEQEFIIMSFTTVGNEAEVLVTYPEPDENDEDDGDSDGVAIVGGH